MNLIVLLLSSRMIFFCMCDSKRVDRRAISRDDLDDLKMLHMAVLRPSDSRSITRSILRPPIPSYLYGLLAAADISRPFPVSSPRCKNRNIEVFGHCPILTVPPYLRAESRRCSDGWGMLQGWKWRMDRDKQGKRGGRMDERRNATGGKRKVFSGKRHGEDETATHQSAGETRETASKRSPFDFLGQ